VIPDPGPKEKRRIPPELTPALRIHGHLSYTPPPATANQLHEVSRAFAARHSAFDSARFRIFWPVVLSANAVTTRSRRSFWNMFSDRQGLNQDLT